MCEQTAETPISLNIDFVLSESLLSAWTNAQADLSRVYLNTAKTPKLHKNMQRHAKTGKDTQRHAKIVKRRLKLTKTDKDTQRWQQDV